MTTNHAPPSDEDHVPLGYDAIKCMMNNEAMADQQQYCEKSYFGSQRRVQDNFFDINWGDPVVTFSTGQQYTGVADSQNRDGTYAMVTSALNGIEAVFNIPEFVKESHVLMNAYLTSRLTWVGCAAAEKKFAYQNEIDHGLFAVAFSGIMSRKVFTHCRVGDTVMWRTPHPKTFSAANYKVKDGVDPGKITLELCPVRQVDLTMFSLGCYDIYRYMKASKNCTDDCVSTMNTTIFGLGLESFALSVLVQGVYRLLQFGYLSPGVAPLLPIFGLETAEVVQNPFPGGDNKGGDLFTKMRSAEGGLVGLSDEDNMDDMVNRIVMAWKPEQVAILLAEVTGLCPVADCQKKPPAGYEFRNHLRKNDYVRGDLFRRVFFQSVFPQAGVHKQNELGMNPKLFKVGGEERRDLARTDSYANGMWKKVRSQNGYDVLQNCFNLSFFNLMSGLNAVNGMEKSMIVGMNLKNAKPGDTTDYVVCK